MEFSFYLPCYWPDTSIHAKVMYDEMLVQAARAEDLGYAATVKSIKPHNSDAISTTDPPN